VISAATTANGPQAYLRQSWIAGSTSPVVLTHRPHAAFGQAECVAILLHGDKEAEFDQWRNAAVRDGMLTVHRRSRFSIDVLPSNAAVLGKPAQTRWFGGFTHGWVE